jgi:hypothetical protein
VERPAYQNPLCYLDGSSIDLDKEVVRFQLHNTFDNGYSYSQQESAGRSPHSRPVDERVPQVLYQVYYILPHQPDRIAPSSVFIRLAIWSKPTFHCLPPASPKRRRPKMLQLLHPCTTPTTAGSSCQT